MKKNILIYIILNIIIFQAQANGVESSMLNAEKAERLWMQRGLSYMLINVQNDLKMNSIDFVSFQKKYAKQIITDKTEFFNQSCYTQSFLLDSVENNYKDWLNEKQAFYYTEAQKFIQDKALGLMVVDSALNAINPGPCAPVDCNNIDFEIGSIVNWNAYTGLACEDASFGYGVCHNFTASGLSSQVQIQTGSGFDPIVNSNKLPVVCPGGTYSLRLENTVNGGNASKITRTFNVTNTNSMYLYKYAVVLEDPGDSHSDPFKPFFSVKVYLLDNDCNPLPGNPEISCANYSVIANSSNSEIKQNFMQTAAGSPYYYKKWTTVAIPLQAYIGQNIRIEFVVSDCAWGGHLGYAYIDGECLNAQPTIGPCVNGEREITAPLGFVNYWWTGDDLRGNNFGNKIKAGGGSYSVLATTISKCQMNYMFDVDSCPTPPPVNCSINALTVTPAACNSNNNTFNLSGSVSFTDAPESGSLIISNGYLSQIYALPLTSPFDFTFNNLMADGKAKTIKASFYKGDFISDQLISCQSTVNYTSPTACYVPDIACVNCLTSFNPEPGRYIISAWVKEIGAAADIETYANPFIEIQFSNGTITLPRMYGSGKIIEKWQRVYYEFNIPVGATDISINLGTNAGAVLFDDIRIHPANGSFVSYVYDPVSLKLVATLDDNNYSTIYEYDNEGTLLRVKKETERGIMTIKESRENSPKR